MKPSLQLRAHQQLSLTPQLQQAIRLLQLSQLELQAELRELVEANPLLDFAEDLEQDELNDDEDVDLPLQEQNDRTSTSDEAVEPNWDDAPAAYADLDFSQGSRYNGSDDDSMEAQNAAPESLYEHLMWQLNMAPLRPREHAIGAAVIDALDNDGYLRESLENLAAALPAELHVTEDEIELVRKQVQQLDPAGVASLDLRDCLASQLDQLVADTPHLDLARRIVDCELELLAKQDLKRLAKRLGAEPEALSTAIALVRNLDPHPGSALDPTPVEYIAPDAYAVRDGERWRVSLNPGCQPRMGLNQHYCGLIAQARREDANWMRGQLQEARWLLKSLQSRADTLLKVAESIVRRQSAFLDYGAEAMHPLVLREVAEEVGMHESTISRVTTRKYLHTPRGIFEFKYFFSAGVSTEDGGSASATAVQAMLRKLVDEEDTRHPLSDQALAAEFNSRGIQVARRTIAKYRDLLRIPSSNERQRAG